MSLTRFPWRISKHSLHFTLLTVPFLNGRMTLFIKLCCGGKMLKEFREFAMRGNVMDLAVAVIIGGAFGKIITSLVNDVLMPLIGLALGGVNFSDQAIIVRDAMVKWGAFVQSIIDFIIIAFVIFMLVRTINRLKKTEPAPAAAPTTKECPHCFTNIPIKATRCPNCTSELA
jgi:large conductance mechanosensitive channel